MTSNIKKSAIAALAALSLGFAVTTTTPAEAFWRGGGWHGGGWGWHGGGWGWRRGWGGGGGWGAPVAAGVLGGLALGAVAASAYPYGYGPYGGYGGCYVQSQPVYNGWGQFVGYRPVRVCY